MLLIISFTKGDKLPEVNLLTLHKVQIENIVESSGIFAVTKFVIT